MEKPFVKVRNHLVNLQAIAYVELTDDGGVAVTVSNRNQPLRMNRAEATEFLGLLTRFTVSERAG